MSLPSQTFSFSFPSSGYQPYQHLPTHPIAGPSSAPQYPSQSHDVFPLWYNTPGAWGMIPPFPGPPPAQSSWTMPANQTRPQLSPLAITDQLPELYLPPSPTDTCSSTSSLSTPASGAALLHPEPVIVCNVPLLAPKPLPYHPPRFLQFDDLPEPDADLSHPPYSSRRPLKRSRADSDDSHDADPAPAQKRVALSMAAAWHPNVNTARRDRWAQVPAYAHPYGWSMSAAGVRAPQTYLAHLRR